MAVVTKNGSTRHTVNEWKAILQDFCQAQSVSDVSFYKWRKRLRQEPENLGFAQSSNCYSQPNQ